MIRLFLISFFFFNILTTFAQTIPNSGFESWIYEGYHGSCPSGWECSNKDYTIQYHGNNLRIDSTVLQGWIYSKAIVRNQKLYSWNSKEYIDTLSGYVYTKFPVLERPETLNGLYSFFPVNKDTAMVYVLLTKWNSIANKADTIGEGVKFFYDKMNTESLFQIDIAYNNFSMPDSAFISIYSSIANEKFPETTLAIDDLFFDGIILNSNDISILEMPIGYPNPANNTIHFKNIPTEATIIEILDYSGRKMSELSIDNSDVVQVLDLFPSGLYHYFIKNKEGIILHTNRFTIVK